MKFQKLYEATYEYIQKASTLPTGRMSSDTDNEYRIGIMFRTGKSAGNAWANSGAYWWNAYGDGWFRSMHGISKGYGLIFKNLKLTTKKPFEWDGSTKYGPSTGSYHTGSRLSLYKATFEYVPNEYTNDADWNQKYEKDNIWLIVPEDVDPMDAIKLVMKDQKKWTP